MINLWSQQTHKYTIYDEWSYRKKYLTKNVNWIFIWIAQPIHGDND